MNEILLGEYKKSLWSWFFFVPLAFFIFYSIGWDYPVFRIFKEDFLFEEFFTRDVFIRTVGYLIVIGNFLKVYRRPVSLIVEKDYFELVYKGGNRDRVFYNQIDFIKKSGVPVPKVFYYKNGTGRSGYVEFWAFEKGIRREIFYELKDRGIAIK